MTDARLTSGTPTSPRVYERIIFTGGDATHGVLHIDYTLHDVVVRDCIIDSGPQNGLTINALDNAVVSNIRFENVIVRPQPRMGVEVTDRTSSGRTTNNWHHLTFDRVTIEPQGSEAFSLCSAMTGDTATTIRDMTIEGSGNRPDLYSWGQGFEINKARGVTVDGLTIMQTRGAAFNLQGPSADTDMLWRFSRVMADMRVRDDQQTEPMGSAAQVVYCKNATGWRFSGTVVTAPTGSHNGYLDNVHGADFTGTTWLRPGSKPYVSQVNGSSGNIALP